MWKINKFIIYFNILYFANKISILIIIKIILTEWCYVVLRTILQLKRTKVKFNIKLKMKDANVIYVKKLYSIKWKLLRHMLLKINSLNFLKEKDSNFLADFLFNLMQSIKWIGKLKWYSLKYASLRKVFLFV